MNTLQPVIIFSAKRLRLKWSSTSLSRDPRLDEWENAQRHCLAAEFLNNEGIQFRECSGVYNLIPETGFVVADTLADGPTIRDLAFQRWDQESIFCIDSNSICYLEYADGRCDRLGKLRVVREGDPLPDNYTVLDGVTYTAGE